jgi:Transposase DDE domain
VAVRLLAERLPEPEAQRRRARARREARRRGRPVSRRKLELCVWNVLVTNAPPELLGAAEAQAVRRVRWQIELLFKLFKSEGKLAECRSRRPGRALCELFARLLAQVVQGWALLAAGYQALRHSARRAARRVRRRARQLLRGVEAAEALQAAVAGLARLLRRCRVGRRRVTPSTFERLLAHDAEFRQGHENAA